jgi:D-alanyl-D-alanine endopeptidase (penicillin-binding protein 7)
MRIFFLSFFSFLLSVFLGAIVPSSGHAARATVPAVESGHALVVDQSSGEILFEKGADEVTAIASITKLMTAMVLIDSGLPLLETITITKADVDRFKGSKSKLRVGTQLLRAEALKLALMASENRAASALATSFPGGKEAFVEAMNQKASSLLMSDTIFVDPTGLRPGNVSTASNLAKLVDAASQYPLISQYSTAKLFDLKAKRGKRNVNLRYVNSNRLVKNSRWKISVSKTGYISESGKCLVMKTEIAGRPIVMVLLDSWGKLTRLGDANRVKKWLEKRSVSKPKT